MAGRYVALLRGINSGRNPVTKMSVIKEVFETSGMRNVKTLLNSGNVIFDAGKTTESALIAKLEPLLSKTLRFNVSVIVRSQNDIAQLVASKPFRAVKLHEASRPNVTFLKTVPSKAQREALGAGGSGFSIVGISDRAVCSVVDLTNANTPDLMRVLDKILGKEITTRTWNTVERILKACE